MALRSGWFFVAALAMASLQTAADEGRAQPSSGPAQPADAPRDIASELAQDELDHAEAVRVGDFARAENIRASVLAAALLTRERRLVPKVDAAYPNPTEFVRS